MSIKRFVSIALLISVLIAGFLSYFASSHPDGLVKVSADKGLDAQVTDSAASDSFFANYGISGLENSTGLAGLVGVVITGVIGYLLIKWVSKSSSKN